MENITIQHILDRRSIRKYQDRSIPKEIVTDLLKAAMNAPTACNQQCWHFVIIENKNILTELSNIHGGYHTLLNSPLTILVCGEPSAAKLESFWEHDCAAAAENILIAAQSYGLGTLWQGVNPAVKSDSDTISRCLHLPENIKPFCLISIGYPNETSDLPCKFNESKVHYNSIW